MCTRMRKYRSDSRRLSPRGLYTIYRRIKNRNGGRNRARVIVSVHRQRSPTLIRSVTSGKRERGVSPERRERTTAKRPRNDHRANNLTRIIKREEAIFRKQTGFVRAFFSFFSSFPRKQSRSCYDDGRSQARGIN